jgi:hypothetical protein
LETTHFSGDAKFLAEPRDTKAGKSPRAPLNVAKAVLETHTLNGQATLVNAYLSALGFQTLTRNALAIAIGARGSYMVIERMERMPSERQQHPADPQAARL